MSFSSGTFTLAAGNPVTTNTTISSSWANTTLSDIATGLSTCMLKDGTQTMTGNLPMSGFKITGLGAGTSAGDSLRYEQAFTTGTLSLLGTLFVTGALNTSKAAAITATATVALGTMTGNYAVITGTNTITSFDATAAGVLRVVEFSGATPITQNATNMILPNNTSIVTQTGQAAFVISENSGNWRWLTLSPSKQSTQQGFTSGSGTYTTPVGATRLRVRLIGAGGGGGGATATNGGNGSNTTFSTLTGTGGDGGGANAGAPGAGGAAAGGTINIPGGRGQGGAGSAAGNMIGGCGGSGAFGGGGGGGQGSGTGYPGATNSGGGGGGNGGAGGNSGAGGGAGGYVEAFIVAPASSYSYSIGTGGTSLNSGVGADGRVIVEEFYD